MKNALRKGYQIEKNFCERLQQEGYITDRAERSMRLIPNFKIPPCPRCKRAWSFPITKKHDTFGLFDVVAKHPDFPLYTLYMQVATRWKDKAWREGYVDEKGKFHHGAHTFPASKYDIVCQVRKEDRKPFEVRMLTSKLTSSNGVHRIEKSWAEFSLEEFLLMKKFIPEEN